MNIPIAKGWLAHVLVIALLATAGGVSYFFKFSERIPSTLASTQTYDFSVNADYSKDNDKVDISAGAALLKQELNYGTPYVFADVFPSDQVLHYLVGIDDNHFAIAYSDATDSNFGKVVICERSGTTVSACGTPANFSGANLADRIAIAKVDSTHVAVAYYTATTAKGMAIIGTVDVGTDSVTFDTLEEKEFNATAVADVAVQALDASNIVITYENLSDGDGYAIIGTLSAGDTLDFSGSTAVKFLDTTSGVGATDISILDSTHFVVTYVDGFGLRKPARVGAVSGTSITFGVEATPGANGGPYSSSDAISSTRFVMGYTGGPAGEDPHSEMGTISGSGAGATITFTDPLNEFQADPTEYTSVASISYVPAFDIGYFAVAFRDATGEASARIGESSGATIVYVHPEKSFTSGSTLPPDNITVAKIFGTTDITSAVLALGYTNMDNNDGVIVLASNDYNNDVPTVQPNASLSPGTVLSWSSFTATETKPANTNIYYQLSADNGTTWKYWNGSNWATATGLTDRNTSTVVAANIRDFPTSTNQLLFRAFLETTDGQNTPLLDNINITYTLAPSIDIKTSATYATSATTVAFDGADLNLYVQALDSNNAGAGSITGTVTNLTHADSESITLTEGASGVFRGSIPIAANALPTSSNSTLEGTNGDQLRVSYTAANTSEVIDDFQSYADTTAMQAGGDWDDLLFDSYDVTGSLPSALITTGPEAGNTSTKWFQKNVSAAGPDGLLGAANASSTLTHNTETTLTSVVLDTDTTINVADASFFITTGAIIKINGDLLSYTGVSGNTLTGVTGIQAGGFPSGATVYPRILNLTLADASAFATSGKVRIDDEIFDCNSSKIGNTLQQCYRRSVEFWTTIPSHTSGTTVYNYDDNPYGLNTYYAFGSISANDASRNFSNRSLDFDFYIDNKNNLSSAAGNNFGWLDPYDPGITLPANFSIAIDDGNAGVGPSAYEWTPANLTNAAWQHISVPVSSFVGGADFSDAQLILIMAATGDGTLGSGSDMTLKIDNLAIGNYVATDTVTGTTGSGLPIDFKTDGTYVTSATSVALPGTAYLELVDAGSTGLGTQVVILTTAAGDREPLVLSETAPGTFRASITTATGAVTNYNGILEGTTGGAINAYSTANIENFQTYANATAMNTAFADQSDVPDNTATLETDNTKYFKKIIPDTNASGMVQNLTVSALNTTGKTFELDLYLNDPLQLHPTGHDFGGSTPGGELVEDFSVLFFETGFAGFSEKIFPRETLTSGWQHLSFTAASVPAWGALPAANMSNIGNVFIAAITGDHTTQALVGNLDIRLDNFVLFDPASTPTTINFAGGSTGGGSSSSHCALPSDVTAFDAQVVSLNTGDMVEMTWVNPASNKPDFLEVRRAPKLGNVYITDANAMATLAIIPNTATYYTDNTAAAGQSYSYLIHSVSSCGVGPSPSTQQVTLPSAIPAGRLFDLHLDLQVKTISQSDEKVLDTIKDVLQNTQNQVKASILASTSSSTFGSTIPEAQAATITGTLATCAGSTDFLNSVSPAALAADPYFIQQVMRTHIEALLRKEVLCKAPESSPFLLQLLEDRLFFMREDAFKYLIVSQSKLLQAQPDWILIDSAVLRQAEAQIQDLMTASKTQLSTQTTLKEALSDNNLLNLNIDTLQNYEDITSNDALKETILSIPDIDKLVKGHQTTFTLEIWPKGKRDNPALIDGKFARYTITTNIFGEATLDIDNFISGDYDITINKAKVLRKALNGYTINRATMALDFTRGLKSREAYIKVGDLNDDGQINTQDLIFAGSALNDFDLNQDGTIDLYDYLIMIQNFGRDE